MSHAANRYLKRVCYGNRAPRQPGEDLRERADWLFEMVLDYGEGHFQQLETGNQEGATVAASGVEQRPWPARRDPISSYRAGFETRTYRLCRRILMVHHFPNELGADDCLVRATRLAYIESPINTVLGSVVQAGYLRQDDGSYQE